jgi:RimJ/RimL family protein N-acetyltransferase
MTALKTKSPEIILVEPDIERDAPVAVTWLDGDIGRNTLRLMGNTEENNKPSSLEEEKERIKGFIESTNQLTWMISLSNKVVGAIWVDIKPTEYLLGPAVHIMIGDPEVRGHGVGTNSTDAVVEYMRELHRYPRLYSRRLTSNEVAAGLLEKSGFSDLGNPYTDSNGLEWQNAQTELL